MQLARVIGTATTATAHPTLARQRLLLCRQLNAQHESVSDPMIVLDQIGAGAHDTIIISSDGKGMRERLHADNSPARWFNLGIVDHPRKDQP